MATPGTAAIAIREVLVPDPSRGIDVRLRVFTPEPKTATTQLVLLTTGLGAELTDFDTLARTLAPSDYAVAVIEHRASTTAQACGVTLRGVDCWHKLEETETHPEIWFDRFSDMSVVLEKLPAMLGVDGGHVGIVGHSFGAFTAMALIGTTFVDPRTNERRDLRDPRIVSVVAMSPQGPRWFGLDEQSWSHIDRPLLMLTGDRDGSPMIDDSPEWRREPFPHMSGGDKLMMRIANAEHMSFTAREKRPEIADLVRRATLAFLNSTLRAKDNAAVLSAEAVKTCSRGHASLERR